jgi:mRNA-degrading endonuclease RelE of RelBE toxin-antitoxin system
MDPAEHPQIKPLAGELPGTYRLRVGGYRAILALLPEEHVTAVINLELRSGAYK